MPKYEVIVGNIGTVHTGGNENAARQAFNEWVKVAKGRRGSRAVGENVILMEDGEPVKEHEGWSIKFDECGPI